MSLIQELQIPEFGNGFSSEIENLVKNSEDARDNSFNKYGIAENVLLQTLGLNNFSPSPEPVNVKKFSESFGNSGRLDAEYYQVKYEQVVERIKSTNYDRLVDIVNIKKSIEPGSAHYSENGFPFVRVSDYDKFGFSTPNKYLSDHFCKENAEQIKKLKPKKETILFSKDGSVGTAYMLRKDADFITSSAILHLTVKDKTKIIPEYLTLALNSKLVQMQAERDAGGSIILHWRVSEIENVVVPVIDFDKQREIADLVEESFKLKKQSEHLLEVAKSAVEMAIEQDEETAMKYIKSETE
jgi:restriction endonuclease S subunit